MRQVVRNEVLNEWVKIKLSVLPPFKLLVQLPYCLPVQGDLFKANDSRTQREF